MPRYPHTKLFVDTHRTVVLSGPHIQVLDTQSGHILRSTALDGGPIRCSGTSKDGRYLATSGDDKQLRLWDLESLALLTARVLPKKPTFIEFTQDTSILVSDKFGDVFRYTLHPNELVEENAARNALKSDENQSDGELILGHASQLTSCILTPDEKFIITADRDEHIRVSWYPQGYVIESYCLGHKKYVSAIHIPTQSPATLISGGGDRELKVWDWMTGRLQRNIGVFAAVEPFIRATAQNRKHTSKEKQRHNAGEPDDCPVQRPLEFPESTQDHPVLVIHRISSFVSGSESHIVFSAVGATAIFESTLTDTGDSLDIRHYDFGKPVIDFVVCGEGTIWVSVDADFSSDTEDPSKLVQVVRWSTDKFVDAGSSPLLDSMNTICSLPATPEDLQALDLYSDLTSLPKNIEVEQCSWVPELPTSIHETPEHEGALASINLSKRALGRLKHKRALDLLHHEGADKRNIPDPITKKMKADSDDE